MNMTEMESSSMVLDFNRSYYTGVERLILYDYNSKNVTYFLFYN